MQTSFLFLGWCVVTVTRYCFIDPPRMIMSWIVDLVQNIHSEFYWSSGSRRDAQLVCRNGLSSNTPPYSSRTSRTFARQGVDTQLDTLCVQIGNVNVAEGWNNEFDEKFLPDRVQSLWLEIYSDNISSTKNANQALEAGLAGHFSKLSVHYNKEMKRAQRFIRKFIEIEQDERQRDECLKGDPIKRINVLEIAEELKQSPPRFSSAKLSSKEINSYKNWYLSEISPRKRRYAGFLGRLKVRIERINMLFKSSDISSLSNMAAKDDFDGYSDIPRFVGLGERTLDVSSLSTPSTTYQQ